MHWRSTNDDTDGGGASDVAAAADDDDAWLSWPPNRIMTMLHIRKI